MARLSQVTAHQAFENLYSCLNRPAARRRKLVRWAMSALPVAIGACAIAFVRLR